MTQSERRDLPWRGYEPPRQCPGRSPPRYSPDAALTRAQTGGQRRSMPRCPALLRRGEDLPADPDRAPPQRVPLADMAIVLRVTEQLHVVHHDQRRFGTPAGVHPRCRRARPSLCSPSRTLCAAASVRVARCSPAPAARPGCSWGMAAKEGVVTVIPTGVIYACCVLPFPQ
jgi:hypothetical protein